MLPPGTTEIALSTQEHVQVLQTMEQLAKARKAQGAAFIQPEGRLVVWTDKVDDLLPHTAAMHAKVEKYLWAIAAGAPVVGASRTQTSVTSSITSSVSASGTASPSSSHFNEKQHVNFEDEAAIATSGNAVQERKTLILAPIIHGLGAALNLILQGNMIRILALEAGSDHQYLRMALIAAVPAILVISLFFTENIVGGLFQILGPIRQMSMNTRYYSGLAPRRMTGELPHITIQMPVYKESLEDVLIPTIESLNKAIATYELQGGSASILISEDGMLLVPEQERARRLDYYDRQQIAWVARPGHNVDGYVRKGRFKKASNLNFTCQVSLRVEQLMQEQRPTDLSNWTSDDEDALYEATFATAVAEAHPLARAAGNVRIGELILLIDCDTRVPEDCFLDAASEMAQSPEVAILQHCSGVMEVTSNNYFEAGIAFFTRTVNFAISFVVSNGDLAPFMGHNAFLRWSALQDLARNRKHVFHVQRSSLVCSAYHSLSLLSMLA